MGQNQNVEIKTIVRGIGQELNEINRTLIATGAGYGLDYLKISQCAKGLLDAVFGEGEYDIPVDIFALVDRLGIELREIKLNEFDEMRVNKIVGRMSIQPNFETGKKNRCIYIDSEAPLFTQRFVVAHELAHLIMDLESDDWWTSVEDCIMPMLPMKISELIADSFAIFLLIPMDPFFKVFTAYVEEEGDNYRWPIITEDWLTYLSLKAQLSFYYVAYAYEQLRYVAYWMSTDRAKYPIITDDILKLLFQ